MENPEPSAPRRVEAYLDQILASLPRRLSAFQLEELRRELRAHLWERVAAYEELGQTEDDAVTEALTQFGGSKDFVKQWQREWTKTTDRVTLREAWNATRSALPLSLSALALTPAAGAAGSWLTYSSSLGGPFLSAVFYTTFLAGIVLLPFALGLAHSRREPCRPGLGMFGALSLEIIGLNALMWLAGLLLPGWEQNRTAQEAEGFLFDMFFWLPLTCGTAALGGWRARRAEARRGVVS